MMLLRILFFCSFLVLGIKSSSLKTITLTESDGDSSMDMIMGQYNYDEDEEGFISTIDHSLVIRPSETYQDSFQIELDEIHVLIVRDKELSTVYIQMNEELIELETVEVDYKTNDVDDTDLTETGMSQDTSIIVMDDLSNAGKVNNEDSNKFEEHQNSTDEANEDTACDGKKCIGPGEYCGALPDGTSGCLCLGGYIREGQACLCVVRLSDDLNKTPLSDPTHPVCYRCLEGFEFVVKNGKKYCVSQLDSCNFNYEKNRAKRDDPRYKNMALITKGYNILLGNPLKHNDKGKTAPKSDIFTEFTLTDGRSPELQCKLLGFQHRESSRFYGSETVESFSTTEEVEKKMEKIITTSTAFTGLEITVSESKNALFSNSIAFGEHVSKTSGENGCDTSSHCIDKNVARSFEIGETLGRNGETSKSIGSEQGWSDSLDLKKDTSKIDSKTEDTDTSKDDTEGTSSSAGTTKGNTSTDQSNEEESRSTNTQNENSETDETTKETSGTETTSSSKTETSSDSIGGSASVGWGPLSASLSYSHDTAEEETNAEESSNTTSESESSSKTTSSQSGKSDSDTHGSSKSEEISSSDTSTNDKSRTSSKSSSLSQGMSSEKTASSGWALSKNSNEGKSNSVSSSHGFSDSSTSSTSSSYSINTNICGTQEQCSSKDNTKGSSKDTSKESQEGKEKSIEFIVPGFKDAIEKSSVIVEAKRLFEEKSVKRFLNEMVAEIYSTNIDINNLPGFSRSFKDYVKKMHEKTQEIWPTRLNVTKVDEDSFETKMKPEIEKKLDEYFAEFIRKFGTHFYESVTMGARSVYHEEYEQVELSQWQDDKIRNCIEKEFKKQVKSKRATVETNDGNECDDENTVKLLRTIQSTKKTDWFSEGGPPGIDPPTWPAAVREQNSPVIIGFTTIPIVRLFDKAIMKTSYITTKAGTEIDVAGILSWFVPRYAVLMGRCQVLSNHRVSSDGSMCMLCPSHKVPGDDGLSCVNKMEECKKMDNHRLSENKRYCVPCPQPSHTTSNDLMTCLPTREHCIQQPGVIWNEHHQCEKCEDNFEPSPPDYRSCRRNVEFCSQFPLHRISDDGSHCTPCPDLHQPTQDLLSCRPTLDHCKRKKFHILPEDCTHAGCIDSLGCFQCTQGEAPSLDFRSCIPLLRFCKEQTNPQLQEYRLDCQVSGLEEGLKNNMKRVKSYFKKSAAFSAVGARNKRQGVVTFKSELFDHLDNFNPTTGIFTVPFSGTYSFVFVGVSSDELSVGLEINVTSKQGTVRGSGRAYGSRGYNTASGNVILHLTKGNQVTLSIFEGELADNNYQSTMLIGFLVHLG